MDVLRRNQFVCIAQDKQSTLKWIDFSKPYLLIFLNKFTADMTPILTLFYKKYRLSSSSFILLEPSKVYNPSRFLPVGQVYICLTL